MATFTFGSSLEQLPAVYAMPAEARVTGSPSVPTVQPYPDEQASSAGTLVTAGAGAPAGNEWPAQAVEQSVGGFDWFEDFHVLLRRYDFGNLLSNQSVAIEVFNAHRHQRKEWTTFTNNAGAGVSLGGEPPLPVLVDALAGVQMTLDVSTAGDPFVDSTLVFFFDGVGTIVVPITIQRIVLWVARPELPYVERLSFLTNVKRSKSGKELRHSPRKSPRRSWDYEFVIDEGIDAQRLENILFDWQASTFGVPVWDEDAVLTAALSAGASAATVSETAWRSFRAGGLAAIVTSSTVFDVLVVDTVGPTSLTFESPTLNSHAVGAEVFPLEPCRIVGETVDGERYPVNLRRERIRFESLTNDVDLADLSPFSSFNGKLLLDIGNSVRGGTVRHSFTRELVTHDGEAGRLLVESSWDRHRRGHLVTIRSEGRQAQWELRGLAYALRGRQVSFYAPRDSDDLVVVANLASGAATMDVQHCGYAQFVRARQPKNVVRVNFVSGAAPLLRTVDSAVESSPTVEVLTMTTTWPSTITPAEVSRVEYVEKLRFDTDDIDLEHDESGNRMRLVAPVLAVLE